jgi:uncharacterized damage-inducible protein DinB
MKKFVLFVLIATSQTLLAQDKDLPYYEIPEQAEKYTAGTVASRIIDGLGFRYYWATEGLREADLKFEPNQDARTVEETLTHIYDLTVIIAHATAKTVNIADADKPKLTFAEMRKRTLNNLKAASDRLRTATDEEMNDFKIVFQRGGNTTEFPFWNNLNGPIADALWHVGQVVTFRRSSGNPFTDKVSLFTGKMRQ